MNEQKMLEELLKNCTQKKDLELVKKAFYCAIEAHKNQKRSSGEPYFIHPYNTALTLAKWGLTNKTIIAGLLHDTLEDTEYTSKKIKCEFGKEICDKVIGVTQIKSKKLTAKKTIKRKSLEKTLLTSINKTQTILIKLADKLHNLETIQFMPEKRQKEIAQSGLEVYAPIAQKLGMNTLKFKIEEICFPIVYPKEFKEIKEFFDKRKPKKLKQVKKAIELLKHELKNAVKFKEFYKPLYILFNKKIKNNDLKEINDFIFLIVVVKSETECYEALGKIHKIFPPIPKKFKDYIAIPKNDIYSALHTTVIGPEKIPLKIYIQSKEMYKIAKKGVLALLAENNEKDILKEKLNWIKKIKNKQNKAKTDKELAHMLGIDSVGKNTFVFDEKGKLIEIPQDFNAIDYFFMTAEKKAPYLKEIEVNKKNSPFKQYLSAGDIIEGKYSLKPTINERWLLLTQNKETHKKIKTILKTFNKKEKTQFYLVDLKVKNKPGMLAKITSTFAKNNINIEEIYQERIDRNEGKNMYVHLSICGNDPKKLNKAFSKLRKMTIIKSMKKKKI
ncbi:MAG: HD domain-containing protein [Candidatus Diapherotrites archaeon]|nr:HD domain-containing protein [Candidatus Diapherotrites archaeon]